MRTARSFMFEKLRNRTQKPRIYAGSWKINRHKFARYVLFKPRSENVEKRNRCCRP